MAGLLLGLTAGATGASAQPVATPGVAVYRYAEPGEPVIAVDVWGGIRQTGRFLIPPDTGVLELLALAGGPVLQPESDAVFRDATLVLSRQTGSGRVVVFETPVDSLAVSRQVLPALQDQDVMTVNMSVRDRFTWLDGITVAAGIASLALLILRVADLSGGI
jgi:hypothetical protein